MSRSLRSDGTGRRLVAEELLATTPVPIYTAFCEWPAAGTACGNRPEPLV